MADDYRIAVMKQFIIPTPAPTAIVNQSFIASAVPARQALLDYHPKIGAGYSITTEIADGEDGTFLRIVPQLGAGSSWSDEQTDLLGKLRFIPMPEVFVEGRKPVLQMMRSGSGNIRLGNTPWYLVYSRIEKTHINGTMYNDVTLIWEFVDPEKKTTYLRPVASCWKW